MKSLEKDMETVAENMGRKQGEEHLSLAHTLTQSVLIDVCFVHIHAVVEVITSNAHSLMRVIVTD